ncbi:hypothetical protein SUDANB108_01162 [Streptomyces sp. enrichment culture]
MYCRPSVESFSPFRVDTLINASNRINPPRTNDATMARMIARGAFRVGFSDSSPSEAAVSKPYMTYAEASEATRKAPRYPLP